MIGDRFSGVVAWDLTVEREDGTSRRVTRTTPRQSDAEYLAMRMPGAIRCVDPSPVDALAFRRRFLEATETPAPPRERTGKAVRA